MNLQQKIKSELAWLQKMGIERDDSVPLYSGQQKVRGKYTP